jgi:hypothetical protein
MIKDTPMLQCDALVSRKKVSQNNDGVNAYERTRCSKSGDFATITVAGVAPVEYHVCKSHTPGIGKTKKFIPYNKPANYTEIVVSVLTKQQRQRGEPASPFDHTPEEPLGMVTDDSQRILAIPAELEPITAAEKANIKKGCGKPILPGDDDRSSRRVGGRQVIPDEAVALPPASPSPNEGDLLGFRPATPSPIGQLLPAADVDPFLQNAYAGRYEF